MKFDYDFKTDGEKVYICYCIPYTYTKLFKFLGTLQDQDNICEILREDILCRSESGVDVPLLTISNFKGERSIEGRLNYKRNGKATGDNKNSSMGARGHSNFAKKCPFYKNKNVQNKIPKKVYSKTVIPAGKKSDDTSPSGATNNGTTNIDSKNSTNTT